jgi:hypothetical protein
MRRTAIVCVTFCMVLGVAASAPAQIPNGEFDSNLLGWLTLGGFYDTGQEVPRGTTDWSSNHGGSAYLTVDGAPCLAALGNFIDEDIHAGDTIRAEVYHTDFGNFAGINLKIGGYHESNTCGQESGAHQCPGPGPCYLEIVADRDYACGTLVWFWFCAWPGQAEAWINWVRVMKATGLQENEGPEKPRATGLLLHAPRPNPGGNGAVQVGFVIAHAGEASLTVYGTAGTAVRTLVSGVLEPGEHQAMWDGTDDSGIAVPNGVYIVRLEAGNQGTSKKVTLVR